MSDESAWVCQGYSQVGLNFGTRRRAWLFEVEGRRVGGDKLVGYNQQAWTCRLIGISSEMPARMVLWGHADAAVNA
jgi:hypothetical protein